MLSLVQKLPCFIEQKGMIEELIEEHGHICIFTPKFHPELAFVELYWAQSKHYTRKRLDRSWAGLKRSIWESFGIVQHENEEKIHAQTPFLLARKTREFVRCYHEEGCTYHNIDDARKQRKLARTAMREKLTSTTYKRHRGAPSYRAFLNLDAFLAVDDDDQ